MILGLGTVLVDQQMLLPCFPKHDTKNEASSLRSQVGGPVPTALVLLARWGHPCRFVGKWSTDPCGAFIASDLESERIGLANSIQAIGQTTGQAHVWVDQSNGQRTVAFTRGDCGEVEVPDVDSIDVSGCRILHLDGWSATAAKRLAERVKSAGGRIVLDSGSPKPGMDQLFPLVDLMNCPVRFAEQYFGDADTHVAAERLLDAGVRRVIFTHGDRGAVYYDRAQCCRQLAFEVDGVIDTNGAGDVFCGSMIHGLLNGLDGPKMIRFAAASAALKCQTLGNRDALPTLEAIESLCESTKCP